MTNYKKARTKMIINDKLPTIVMSGYVLFNIVGGTAIINHDFTTEVPAVIVEETTIYENGQIINSQPKKLEREKAEHGNGNILKISVYEKYNDENGETFLTEKNYNYSSHDINDNLQELYYYLDTQRNENGNYDELYKHIIHGDEPKNIIDSTSNNIKYSIQNISNSTPIDKNIKIYEKYNFFVGGIMLIVVETTLAAFLCLKALQKRNNLEYAYSSKYGQKSSSTDTKNIANDFVNQTLEEKKLLLKKAHQDGKL